jgi:hypothetical protein
MIMQQLNQHPSFEIDPDVPPFQMKLSSGKVFRDYKRLHYRAGVDPRTVQYKSGYADMAIDSFATFDRLQREGVIPAGVRFQVSIPSPEAPTYNYVPPKIRAIFLEACTTHLIDAAKRVAAAIPHDRRAVQWDVLHEISLIDNYFQDRADNYLEQLATTHARLDDAIPEAVELGYHLCYGSPEDEHLVQPKDTQVLVELMHEISRTVRRPIRYFHIPVPKPRTDAAYFQPLSKLALRAGTDLYVGLVHMQDDAGNRAPLNKRAVSPKWRALRRNVAGVEPHRD